MFNTGWCNIQHNTCLTQAGQTANLMLNRVQVNLQQLNLCLMWTSNTQQNSCLTQVDVTYKIAHV